MPALEAPALHARSEKAWTTKDLWSDVLSDAYRYALPMRNLHDGSPGDDTASPGQSKMVGVYDSTAIISTIKFANRVQADFMPPYRQWLDFVPGPFIPDQHREEIGRRLQDVKRKFFAVLHASNFDTAVNECLLELAAGTGALLVMGGDDDDIADITSIPMAQLAITEGPKGKLDGFFRRFSLPVRLVKAQWKDAKLPDALDEVLKDKPEDKQKFEECTYYDYEEKLYRYSVIWKDAASANSESVELVSRTYKTCPWIVPRWVKIAGEAHGRGPLLFALPDIRTANAVVALVLKNASFAVSGMFVAADDGVINVSTIRVQPGAVITAKNADNFRVLEFGGRFDVSQLVLDEMRNNIRQILFDRGLPPDTGQPRTATEIVERIKQLQQDIGAPFGRLMRELVHPLVTRILDIMASKKMIEPVKVNGLTVDVKATSPLAQAQNLSDVESAVQWAQILAGLSPEALPLNVMIEDMGEWLGSKLGVDKALIRPKQQREEMMKAAGVAAAQGNVIPIGGGAQGGGIPAGNGTNPAAVGMAA